MNIRLEKCTIEDAENIYVCRTDAVAVKNSFQPPPDSYETHLEWYRKRISGLNTVYYKAVNNDGDFVGFVRIDRDLVGYAVSICILPEYRHRGYSAWMITEAMRIHGDGNYYASIKIGNTASFKAFSKVV